MEQSSGNNIWNSRILKRVNCINSELKFSKKSTMSSLNIYFSFYRNDKFYYKSLKSQVSVLGLMVQEYKFVRHDIYRSVYKEWLKFRQ